jgi:hypothetical protein
VDNDALVAALGRDAATAVACYREQVVAEAARQGLPLHGGSLVDPIDIRAADRALPPSAVARG